jgi:hypothetical protein
MRYGFVPVGRDDLEMPCIFMPDGGHAPGALYGGGTAEFRCIVVPEDYDGPGPGYPWIEVGRIVLEDETPINPATTGTWPTAKRGTQAGVTSPSRPAGPVSIGMQPSTVAHGGGPDARSRSSGVADLDIAATMAAWNAASDPRTALAAFNSASDTSPAIKSLAQYSPASPIPTPFPPVFIPGTLENEDFVRSTIHAGEAVLEAIGDILHSEPSGGEPNAADQRQSKPPTGSRPIDQTQWAGDHEEIKEGIDARPTDDVRISPNGDVWAQNPDGSWTNHGPAADYTGSGKPSGRTGRDRERRR